MAADEIEVLARYSRWKAAALAILMLCLAFVPNLPHFGEGLKRTAYFYGGSGNLVRVAASAFLCFIGLLLAFQAVRSNLSTRAVWVARGKLHWLDYRERSAPLSSIRRLDRMQGLVRIKRDDGPDIQIATVLLRSKADVDTLLSLTPERTI